MRTTEEMHFNSVIFYASFFFFVVSGTTGLQGKGEDISLTPHYHFHPLHRHLDISRAITTESPIAHYGKSLISVFQHFFGSIDKMFILAGRLGTRLSFYEL